MWEFITGQFYSNFETICVEITEVIHAYKAKKKSVHHQYIKPYIQ